MSKNGYEQFFKKAQAVRRKSVPPRKPRPQIPWRAAIVMFSILIFASAYLIFPESMEKLWGMIEIRAIGGAQAETTPAEKSPVKENSAVSADASKSDKSAAAAEPVAEDVSHYEKLKQRKEDLDRRERELSELEEELQKQKVELDKRIVQLEEMRNQIAQVLKDRVEMDQEKVTKLVDLYSNMKPKQAADVIATINEDLAVEVLAKMKKKNAAEIMNLLPADKAKVLSEKYTGYRQAHGEKG